MTKRKSWKELHLGEEAAGGLSAGIVGTVIGFPLDTVKTRMQTGSANGNIFQVARTVAKQEGLLSLYKGIGPPLISLSILGTLTFTQYSYFQEVYQSNPGFDGRNYVAGVSCSPVAGMVSTIENLVKTQMQMDNVTKKEFQSSFDCVRKLVERHGWRVVYTGHGVNTLREAAFLGNYFFMYEGLREFLIHNHWLHVQVAVPVAGGLAGAFAWFVSFPLDCVRAGVQGQLLPAQKSALRVCRDLIRDRGIRGLYSGASASVTRAFLVSGSRFSAYEFALFLLRGGRHYEGHH